MLSQTDISFILNNAYTSEHDYFYYSLLLGEPYLIDGCLCYFDGEHLTIEGSHLQRNPIDENRLLNIISKRSEFTKARSIWYWGPSSLSLNAIPGRQGVLYSSPCDMDTDQYIKLDQWSLSKLPKARNRARHAEKNGVVVKMSSGTKIITWQHFELMRQFYQQHSISLSDTMFSMAVRSLFVAPNVRLLDVHDKDNKLVGFGLINEMFPKFHSLLQSFFSRACPGAADLFYLKMIENAQSSGVERLHFGHSVGSKGLSDFKRKWGAEYKEEPYTFVGYFYPNDYRTAIDSHFFSFWEKMVGDQLFQAWSKKFENHNQNIKTKHTDVELNSLNRLH